MYEMKKIAKVRAAQAGMRLFINDMKKAEDINAADIQIKNAYMFSKRVRVEMKDGTVYIIESIPTGVYSGRYNHTIRKEV